MSERDRFTQLMSYRNPGTSAVFPFLSDSEAPVLASVNKTIQNSVKARIWPIDEFRFIGEHGNVIPSSYKLIYDCNVPLSDVDLPSSLQKIEFTANFNQQIVPGVYPGVFYHLVNLKEIKFINYNQRILPNVLPEGLTSLELSSTFNNGNEPLELHVFPNSLKTLNLGAYNQPLRIGVLPSNLKKLNMDGFNQELEPGVFDGVTEIKLKHYNKPIQPGIFQEGLTTLELGIFFKNGNEPLKLHVFPSTLKNLDINGYNQPLDMGVLPINLNTLYLINFNCQLKPGDLPHSLFALHLFKYNHELFQGHLPNGIQVLTMVNYSHIFKPGDLPNSLRYLTLEHYNHELKRGDLPHSIRNLSLVGNYAQSIKPGVLHEGLKSLTLGSQFTKPIYEKGILPKSLETLEFYNEHYSELSVDAIPNDTLRIILTFAPDKNRLAHQIEREKQRRVIMALPLPVTQSPPDKEQTWFEYFFKTDDFKSASGGLHGYGKRQCFRKSRKAKLQKKSRKAK